MKNKKDDVIIILLIVVIVVTLVSIGLRACKNKNTDTSPDYAIEDAEDWDGTSPTGGKTSEGNSETMSVMGYGTMYVSAEAPTVSLINKKGNTVYMKYTITSKEGEEIYETDLIAPDKMVNVDFYKLLDKGENTLTFTMQAYDLNDMSECNGTVQDVTIIVE